MHDIYITNIPGGDQIHNQLKCYIKYETADLGDIEFLKIKNAPSEIRTRCGWLRYKNVNCHPAVVRRLYGTYYKKPKMDYEIIFKINKFPTPEIYLTLNNQKQTLIQDDDRPRTSQINSTVDQNITVISTHPPSPIIKSAAEIQTDEVLVFDSSYIRHKIICKTCNMDIELGKYHEHKTINCTDSNTICKHCQTSIRKSQLDNHLMSCERNHIFTKLTLASCPVCFEEFINLSSDDVLILSCGHFLCSICIASIIEHARNPFFGINSTTIKCPLCKTDKMSFTKLHPA